jgi:hypothetical protein
MSAKINVIKIVHHAKEIAHRNAFIQNVHRNAVKFAFSARSLARINVSIQNARGYVIRFVTETLALSHAQKSLTVVMIA